ncbi:TPA: hypothetical protein ACV5K0_001811 [Klebsiella aerogenes]|uniref:hypothetical protein n=1 Tax=Klebsiella aerogenes TaxID=548 RepID=UPI00301E0B3B|nr:hypothetical protein [Klebsiella aerogenes]
MTDITRLLASLKRRSAHAKEFGDSITFVKLEDIDALVEALEKKEGTIHVLESSYNEQTEALEKAKSTNAAQDDHINQQQDRIEQLEKRNAELGKHVGMLEKRLKGTEESLIASTDMVTELESRTVTVKQFDEFQICHYGATEDYAKGYIDCQNNFFKWLTAAGIKWEDE